MPDPIIGGGLSLAGGLIGGAFQKSAAGDAADAQYQAALAQVAASRNFNIGNLATSVFNPSTLQTTAAPSTDVNRIRSQASDLRAALYNRALAGVRSGFGFNPAMAAEIDRQRASLNNNLFGVGRLGVTQGAGLSVGGRAFQPEQASFQEGVTRALFQEQRAERASMLDSYLAALGAETTLRETPLRAIAGVPGATAQFGSTASQLATIQAGQGQADAIKGLFSFLGNQIGNSNFFGQGNFGVNPFGGVNSSILPGEFGALGNPGFNTNDQLPIFTL